MAHNPELMRFKNDVWNIVPILFPEYLLNERKKNRNGTTFRIRDQSIFTVSCFSIQVNNYVWNIATAIAICIADRDVGFFSLVHLKEVGNGSKLKICK